MRAKQNVRHRVGTDAVANVLNPILSAYIFSQLINRGGSYGEGYEWGDFRVAWLAVFGVWLIGMTGAATAQIMVSRCPRGESDVRDVDEEPES